MSGTVIVERAAGVRSVTLNRPERLNAINHELVGALQAALAEAEADAGTRVIVLGGAGRAFCAGDDLKAFDEQARGEAETRAYVESIQAVTRALVLGDTVVIGAARGWAAGGGFEWLLNCDFVLLAEDARLFFPEVGIGLCVTGGATTLLPRLVGLAKARELLFLGERIDARTALELGLAYKVVAGFALEGEARALAARIAALPAHAVREMKRALNRACHLDVEGAMALETEATTRCFLAPATRQRVEAFGRKR